MNVEIEVPIPWMESLRDGERNRAMFEAVRGAIAKRGYACHWEDIEFRTETRRRTAPDGGFRLSYHSYGDARHVWRIKETPLPHFYSFDRLGFSGWSESAVFVEQYREIIENTRSPDALMYCEGLRHWLVSNNLSKYAQPPDAAMLPDDFVFFPLQVRSDIVARFCRIDPLLVLQEAAKLAKQLKMPLVVKRHPYCESRLTRAALAWATAGNPYCIQSDASVSRLLAGARSVIVANSGVGLEALVHRKPVHAFASSEYALATRRIGQLPDVRAAFSDAFEPPPIAPEHFVHFYLKELCFDARAEHTIDRMLDLAQRSAEREIWCESSRFSPALSAF